MHMYYEYTPTTRGKPMEKVGQVVARWVPDSPMGGIIADGEHESICHMW